MKNHYRKAHVGSVIVAGLLIFLFSFLQSPFFSGPTSSAAQAAESKEIPAKGMVTMVDLGAKKCVPCKMMAPIIEKVTDMMKIAGFGVFGTPAVVINGEVKSVGKIPKKDDVKKWLAAAK